MILDDLRDYLSTGGVTASIVVGLIQEAPANTCVFLTESDGGELVKAMAERGGTVIEWPVVDTICRASTYRHARQLAQQVFVTLHAMPRRTLNGTLYQWAEATQSPYSQGEDDNGRSLIACAYRIGKSLSTSTST